MTERVPAIGVGMLGTAFMGRAHANAYRAVSTMTWPPPMMPELAVIAGRDPRRTSEAARRFGFGEGVVDWRALVADPRVALVDNCGPNDLHREPTVAALREGKHVICEKPLGRDAGESREIWREAKRAGVTHMCAFNYRFVPAVRLAHEMLSAGELGEIRHFRARYLQAWGAESDAMSWRFDRGQAGSGALGDLGAHVVDLARHLVGEIATVSGQLRTVVGRREGRAVDVDDAFQAVVEFADGATGTLEASRMCLGRANQLTFEINGSRGSLAFDLERLNELTVARCDRPVRPGSPGLATVLVTEPDHPFLEHWWPPGHTLGWEHTFVHEIHHLLAAIAAGTSVRPLGADFEDGYRAAEVCDAIARSSETGRREDVAARCDGA